MGGARGSADGRVLRGLRNRDAVVEAFLSLIEEGDPRPTARVIAARAGLSVRSVFQHFADLEAVYEAAGRRQMRKMGTRFTAVDPSMPLQVRLPMFVTDRCAALEEMDAVARSARLREPFSTQLQANRSLTVDKMRDQVERTFAPEIAEMAAQDPGRGAVLVLVLATSCSWACWYHLRNDQGLDVRSATSTVMLSLSLLLRADVSTFPEVSLPR